MTAPLGAYTFLPFVRQGINRSVTATDGDTNVRLRATARVDVTITGQPLPGTPALSQTVGRDIELYGPGEIIGIEPRAIVRTDPRPDITNVEPNYLAHIEFYDEDFPWRYTPAAPQGLGQRPWITLAVLKRTPDANSEFRNGRPVPGRPLPYIEVKDYTAFPAPADLWAWAHVHSNRHLGAAENDIVASDVAAAVSRLEAALATNRDLAYSRIVCPRRLEVDTEYHAFLVPTFERGRLAGLGIDPDTAPFATASAWQEYPPYVRKEALSMPYYHRWQFRTGGEGDFESLVRLLKWTTVDPRVGYRDIDVLAPGSTLPPIDDADLHGILRLGGALRAPFDTLTTEDRDIRTKYEKWWGTTYPHPFQKRFAEFVNLGDAYTRTTAADANAAAGIASAVDDVDPIITAPIYGQWQALQHRLLTNPDGTALDPDDNWIHNLNLDPPHRVAAGFGGDVVRKNQEDYMEAAWKQIGDVLAHNQKARVALTVVQFETAAHAKTVAAMAAQPTRALSLTAPVQSRVLTGEATVRHARQLSRTPAVLTSSPMRRITRPQGPVAKRLALASGPHATSMLEAVNEGAITAAPPKRTPAGLTTVEGVAATVDGPVKWLPDWVIRLSRRLPWLRWALLVLAVLLLILAIVAGPAAALLIILAILALAAAALLIVAARTVSVGEAIGPALDDEASIDHLPSGPGFVFGIDQPAGTGSGPDNEAAKRFKEALKDWGRFVAEANLAGREIPPVKLDLNEISAGVVDAVQPHRTIPRRFLAGVELADHIRAQIVEVFDEVRYYPRIDEPMYRPLKELSDDHFVPRLDLIERDSVVALETNQPFIEAYMVGVNHEFSRELLWREYPTDLRGSYFRQFWDITSQLAATHGDADARDKLYDIPPIHTWPRRSTLGQHDNRQTNPAETRDEIVLVVRGELLKKYPNTVVYAHKAEWGRKANGDIDPSLERRLIDLVGAEIDKPPPDKVLTPIYEAKVEPDIYFFGFSLTAAEVRGGTGDEPGDPPGWFFVLKERPGEPRFGLDISRPAGEKPVTVNDLTWSDAGVTAAGAQLKPNALSAITLDAPSAAHDDLEKQPQHDDDVRAVGAPVSAARWAYLLYQMPVMVAVHGAELLQDRQKF